MILSILAEILALVVQALPTIVEYVNDAHGDYNKRVDVIIRIVLSATAIYVTVMLTNHSVWESVLMTFAIFFLVFDYWVTAALIRNRKMEHPDAHWFRTIGKKGWFDEIELWIKIGPWGRFAVKAITFVLAIFIYFIW